MRTVHGRGLRLLLLVLAFGADWSLAQGYPTKPIRIHVAGTGGGSDLASRIFAPEISTTLGQPVVIENRPSTPAITDGVAKAAPDGYTLLVNGSPVWIAPLFGEVPYDPIRDLVPIGMLSRSPSVLAVHPSLPVRSVAELIQYAKARPGELNNSSGGEGGSAHVAGELFKSLAKVNIVRVQYKNQAQENLDLLSGQIHMTISASITPFVQSGKLRALAIGGSRPSLLFPDLPTIAESLPGYQAEQLVAFFAPGKTPDAVVRRLNLETMRVLDRPDIRDKFLKVGVEVAGGAPELLTDYMKSEMARVSKMIKDMGIKPSGA